MTLGDPAADDALRSSEVIVRSVAAELWSGCSGMILVDLELRIDDLQHLVDDVSKLFIVADFPELGLVMCDKNKTGFK